MNKMSFRDYTFRNNPEKLNVVYSNRLRTFYPPGNAPVFQNLGQEYRIVTGRGDFFGDDAFSDFFRLAAEFERNESGLLTLPGFDSFNAVFKKLELVGEAGPGLIGYRFEFWEIPGKVTKLVPYTWYTVKEGESLWDVSASTGVSVESLLSLNPGIRNPFDVQSGQEVRLR